MPALSFVADLQDSSWGGRGSPGNHKSPHARRRRSPLLPGKQQRPKQKQRNSWERAGNENTPNHKEAYHETHGERDPPCSGPSFFVSCAFLESCTNCTPRFESLRNTLHETLGPRVRVLFFYYILSYWFHRN